MLDMLKITKNKEVRFIFLLIRLLPRPYRTPRHDVSLIYCETQATVVYFFTSLRGAQRRSNLIHRSTPAE